MPFYVIKVQVQQQYGGPEEGGWWYDHEEQLQPGNDGYEPVRGPYSSRDIASAKCRGLNQAEQVRRAGLQYDYTSVLSHRERFYSYVVADTPTVEPTQRPHYE